MQSGDLVVSGTDQITIKLRQFPAEVKLEFVHPTEASPSCAPNHHNADTLEYEVQSTAKGVELVISWSVSVPREIKWHAYY